MKTVHLILLITIVVSWISFYCSFLIVLRFLFDKLHRYIVFEKYFEIFFMSSNLEGVMMFFFSKKSFFNRIQKCN